MYPESNNVRDLCTFFGVLAGHEMRNEDFEINEGTSEFDNNGVEIYTRDIIVVHYVDAKTQQKHSELAKINYHEGCFNAVNNNGLDVDIASCIRDGNHYVVIVGHEYEPEWK